MHHWPGLHSCCIFISDDLKDFFLAWFNSRPYGVCNRNMWMIRMAVKFVFYTLHRVEMKKKIGNSLKNRADTSVCSRQKHDQH